MPKAIGSKVKKDCNGMPVKFLLVQDNDGCKQDILNSVAGFLWDSGHEARKTDPHVPGT